MPAYVPETIIWISVLAFGACVIAGVLMIFGVLKPQDPAVRKWLFGGVITVVVGAVATFAVRQFDTTPAPPPVVRPDRPDPRAGKSAGNDAQPSPSPPVEAPSEADPTREAPAIPPELRKWASETLGARPVLQANAEQAYPPCVSRLRNSAAAVDDGDALDCRRDLQKFHMDVIVSYYESKRPYDRRLEAEELALRKGGLDAGELAKYNYIIAEMDRLNGAESAEENAVHLLEERVLGDIRRCTKSQCR